MQPLDCTLNLIAFTNAACGLRYSADGCRHAGQLSP